MIRGHCIAALLVCAWCTLHLKWEPVWLNSFVVFISSHQPLNSTPFENKCRMLVLAESSIFSVCLFTSQLSNSHHSQLHLFDIIKIMWIATKNSTKCCFNYFRFLIKLVIKMSTWIGWKFFIWELLCLQTAVQKDISHLRKCLYFFNFFLTPGYAVPGQKNSSKMTISKLLCIDRHRSHESGCLLVNN